MQLRRTFVLAALAAAARASPVRRTESTDTADITVATFADVLEQFESQFYAQALSKFQPSDFNAAGFMSAELVAQQFTAIQSDEATHDTVLQALLQSLGASPLTTCSFDFSTALSSVSTMIATARIVENTGVNAYIGAAHLVSDPSILSSAASIATIEARHQTMLNIFSAGAPIPQAFDIPMLPQEVLAIAGPFISGCDLGLPANTPLTVTNTGTVTVGTSLTFSSTAISSSIDPSTLTCQMLAGGLPFSITLPYTECVVPASISGPVLVYVTNNSQPLINDPVTRFMGDIVAGPTMAFIDQSEDIIDMAVSMSTLSSSSSSSYGMGGSSESSSSSSYGGSSSSSSSYGGSSSSDSGSMMNDTSSSSSCESCSSGSSSSDSSDSASVASSTSTTTLTPAEASAVASSYSAAGATPVANAAGFPPTAPTPLNAMPVAMPSSGATGLSPDGAISVMGMSMVAAPTPAADSSDASPAPAGGY